MNGNLIFGMRGEKKRTEKDGNINNT